MVGSFKRLGAADAWSSVVYVDDVVAGNAVNANNNANVRNIPIPGGAGETVTLTAVPSAISVQVMNPEALQTTTGIVAMGVCHTQLDINNRLGTWAQLSDEFISYFKPRLCSAGKLALRGVQMNSYPLNMSAISDFRPIVQSGDTTTTLDGSKFAPEGWAPIVIVNENGVGLELLITVEWRVRFDIGNPAVASHQHHGVTPDASWNKMLSDAISLGNGVVDIVERVASAGQAIATLAQPPRGRPMLV